MPASSATTGRVTTRTPTTTAIVWASDRSMPLRQLGRNARRPGHSFTPAPAPINSPPTTAGDNIAATAAADGAMSNRLITTGPSSATPTIQYAAPLGTVVVPAPDVGPPRRHNSRVSRASVTSANTRKLVTYEKGSRRGPAMTSAAPGGYCHRASANGAVEPCSRAADHPSYSRTSPRTSCWVPGRAMTTHTRSRRVTSQIAAQPMAARNCRRPGSVVIAAENTSSASRSRYGIACRWARNHPM